MEIEKEEKIKWKKLYEQAFNHFLRGYIFLKYYPNCSDEFDNLIKKGYLYASKIIHPDINKKDPYSTIKFIALKEAYNNLKREFKYLEESITQEEFDKYFKVKTK